MHKKLSFQKVKKKIVWCLPTYLCKFLKSKSYQFNIRLFYDPIPKFIVSPNLWNNFFLRSKYGCITIPEHTWKRETVNRKVFRMNSLSESDESGQVVVDLYLFRKISVPYRKRKVKLGAPDPRPPPASQRRSATREPCPQSIYLPQWPIYGSCPFCFSLLLFTFRRVTRKSRHSVLAVHSACRKWKPTLISFPDFPFHLCEMDRRNRLPTALFWRKMKTNSDYTLFAVRTEPEPVLRKRNPSISLHLSSYLYAKAGHLKIKLFLIDKRIEQRFVLISIHYSVVSAI